MNLNNLNKILAIGGRAGTAGWRWLKAKPAVQVGFILILLAAASMGGVTFLTWIAHSERVTPIPEKGEGGSVAQEAVSTMQRGEAPAEIVGSSVTPVETAEAPSVVKNEDGTDRADTYGTSAPTGCAPGGVLPEATADGVVANAEECTDLASVPLTPTAPAASPAKALPQAGGVGMTSLLGLGIGTLLVGGGLLARRFTE